MNSFNFFAALLFISLVAAPSHARQLRNFNASSLVAKFSGDGTAFSDSVTTGEGFACSFRYLSPKAGQQFVAINAAQWDEGRNCGKCVRARCIDNKCITKGVEQVMMIVDKCPECAMGALDFSYKAYKDVTGSWPNRLKVEWDFVDCGEMIDGTIKIDKKDGNPYYSAWYLGNYKKPIKSFSINGVSLSYNDFNFWVFSSPLPSAPYKISLTSEDGETVQTEIPSLDGKNVDLKVQFN